MQSNPLPAGQETAPTFVSKARRAQIVEAAIATIDQVGCAGASLERIAEQAGVSKGTVLYHFGGRAALMREIITYIYVTGAEFMWNEGLAQATESGSAIQELYSYIRTNITFIARHLSMEKVFTDVVMTLRNDDGSPAFTAEDEEPVLAPLVDILDRGVAAGEFRTPSTRIMAIAIRSVIDATPRELRTNSGNTAPTESFIKATTETLMAALGAVAKPGRD